MTPPASGSERGMRERPPWLADTKRTDWLYNGGNPPSEEVWALLDWENAWVDLGPSPMGNLGPYWHVPLDDGDETVQRLYPKILKSKWLLIIRQAIEEWHNKASDRAKAARRINNRLRRQGLKTIPLPPPHTATPG